MISVAIVLRACTTNVFSVEISDRSTITLLKIFEVSTIEMASTQPTDLHQ
jgi:hypothetical protein